MTNLLMKSKIYLDFGYHPGKIGLREAALFGNCVITNLKGSAAFIMMLQYQVILNLEKFQFKRINRLTFNF